MTRELPLSPPSSSLLNLWFSRDTTTIVVARAAPAQRTDMIWEECQASPFFLSNLPHLWVCLTSGKAHAPHQLYTMLTNLRFL